MKLKQKSTKKTDSQPMPVVRPRQAFPRNPPQAKKTLPAVPEFTTCPIAMTVVKRVDFILHTLAESKITLTSMRAVIKLYIAAEGGEGTVSHSTLAAMMGITGAAITRVADTIENLGYAVRSADANDRRSTLIRLTPLGMQIAEWLESELPLESSRIQAPAPHCILPLRSGVANAG